MNPKITFTLALLLAISTTQTNIVKAGGAEGHGGGDVKTIFWLGKIHSAKQSIRSVIEFPEQYHWSQISYENRRLFSESRFQLFKLLENTRMKVLTGSREYFYAEDCLHLSASLEFEIAVKYCESMLLTESEIIGRMAKLLLEQSNLPSDKIESLSQTFELLIAQKFRDASPSPL